MAYRKEKSHYLNLVPLGKALHRKFICQNFYNKQVYKKHEAQIRQKLRNSTGGQSSKSKLEKSVFATLLLNWKNTNNINPLKVLNKTLYLLSNSSFLATGNFKKYKKHLRYI